jgi:predicted chitinase
MDIKTPLQREIRLREALKDTLVELALYADEADFEASNVRLEAEAAIAESEAATAPRSIEITHVILQQVMPRLPAAKRAEYLPHLNRAMAAHDIDTPLRTAAFLGQTAHESGEFRWLEEQWGANGGTTAQKRYEPPSSLATRLGNTEKGDGYRYRGRGIIQLTGRANYKKYGDILGVDFVSNPDLAADPKYAFETAALYWKLNGCNELADKQDFVGVTKKINGGTNGLAERERYYALAKSALGVEA